MLFINTSTLHTIGAVAKYHFLILFSVLSISLIIAIPLPAQAHTDAPRLSIDVGENRYGNKRHRRAYRYRNEHSYHHDHSHRHHRGYYRDRSRSYENNQYRNRHNYYYDRRSRRADVCPVEGYSSYYNDNLNCYRHKNHFHCN